MNNFIWNSFQIIAIVWLTALVGYSLCLIAAAWCVEQEHRKFRQETDAGDDRQRGTTPKDYEHDAGTDAGRDAANEWMI